MNEIMNNSCKIKLRCRKIRLRIIGLSANCQIVFGSSEENSKQLKPDIDWTHVFRFPYVRDLNKGGDIFCD